MKWLFVILLAVNLVYFGWELDRQTRIDTGNTRQVLPVPADAGKLTLITEMEVPPPPRGVKKSVQIDTIEDSVDNEEDESLSVLNQDESDVQIKEEFVSELVSQLPDISIPDISGGTAGSPIVMCFSYGPFPDTNQLNELIDWFRERNVEASQRLEAGDENQLFWIYLAPLASRDGALQTMEDLKKKGVKDYRLIETGDLRNAISLGLFSTQASVNRRLSELNDKGYKPVVIPRRDKKAVYWIDVRLTGQQEVLNQMFTGYPARYNSIPVKCSEIAL